MEIKKRKYKQSEVIEIVSACKNEYERKLADKEDEINQLNAQILQLKSDLVSAKDKEGAISSVLLRAEQLAKELSDKAEIQYSLEVERIKKFSIAWNDYFHGLREKYPHYQPVQDALGVIDILNEYEEHAPAKNIIEDIDGLITGGKENFDPKRKIRDYIAATGDNGFNLDEVLNPGELELEEICKELGLLDGDE